MAPPNRPPPRRFEVLSAERLTPSMHRVTLGGEGMDGFPAGQQGGYLKFRVEPEGSEKPIVRTYTIRRQRADALDVDFALHGAGGGDAGPATEWALSVAGGEAILVGGPGMAKPLPEGADWYIVAGDMTALPAIGVNLEALPRDAKGVAVIEIQHEDDKQAIDAPAGVELHWLVNPRPGARPEMLADHVRSLGWREGRVYGWVASEFEAMRALRGYLREERGLGPADLYISSYWKKGASEDAHKAIKRDDAEASAA
ncbi:MAG: siderophore-interacting protein [Novosphingobium sp.]|nr:siderophore-interacting protein [Novosphingobium sp.]MBO9603631.1 siderophore-interacting protein [Novosphingobium sp.]